MGLDSTLWSESIACPQRGCGLSPDPAEFRVRESQQLRGTNHITTTQRGINIAVIASLRNFGRACMFSVRPTVVTLRSERVEDERTRQPVRHRGRHPLGHALRQRRQRRPSPAPAPEPGQAYACRSLRGCGRGSRRCGGAHSAEHRFGAPKPVADGPTADIVHFHALWLSQLKSRCGCQLRRGLLQ